MFDTVCPHWTEAAPNLYATRLYFAREASGEPNPGFRRFAQAALADCNEMLGRQEAIGLLKQAGLNPRDFPCL